MGSVFGVGSDHISDNSIDGESASGKISCEQIDFAFLICVLVTSIYLFILAKQANVETLKSGLSQSTVIYDKKNEEAGTLYAQKEHM